MWPVGGRIAMTDATLCHRRFFRGPIRDVRCLHCGLPPWVLQWNCGPSRIESLAQGGADMRRGPNGLPRRVKCGALLVLTLIAPVSALAQSEPAGSSDGPATQAGSSGKPAGDILNMDIEQLAKTPVVVPSMDIPVTSVTKEASTVGRSAAAVFVITTEMIRRSGATCIPEALRMAPGVEVAQVNSNTWAITSRGFNSAYSNKLLVLIDGRSVYNPDFSGVYWDVQDVLLEDVERIEVIRGPGGTLWGANAVNGVINVITKKAKDTQGVYVTAGGGSHEQDARRLPLRRPDRRGSSLSRLREALRSRPRLRSRRPRCGPTPGGKAASASAPIGSRIATRPTR